MEDNITMSRAEYDALMSDSLKLEMLLSALFKDVRISNCTYSGLDFFHVGDCMGILFPDMCADEVEKHKKESEQNV